MQVIPSSNTGQVGTVSTEMTQDFEWAAFMLIITLTILTMSL